MTEKPNEKPKLELVDEPPPSVEDVAALDQDEQEYRRLRCDLPGVAGAAAQGIVSVSVSKAPTKNEFFRTHGTFRPELKLVNVEVGMEKQYFAVDPSMEVPLHGIGINFTEHTLYLTIRRAVPSMSFPSFLRPDNDYNRTKEIGLLEGVKRWVRLYTDQENKQYRIFPAPARPVRRPAMAAAERRQDLPTLLPRQGPADR